MTFEYTTPEGNHSDDQHVTHNYTLRLARNGGTVLEDESGTIYQATDRLPGSLLRCAAAVVERQETEYASNANRLMIDNFLGRNPW